MPRDMQLVFADGRWQLEEVRCPCCNCPVTTTDYGGFCCYACWAEDTRADGYDV